MVDSIFTLPLENTSHITLLVLWRLANSINGKEFSPSVPFSVLSQRSGLFPHLY